ncbi:hypothetical protein ES703_72889 [subsurface metagenome]
MLYSLHHCQGLLLLCSRQEIIQYQLIRLKGSLVLAGLEGSFFEY